MPQDTNSSGSIYSTSDWLSNHFSIKSQGRFEYVSRLPIQAGNKVLDVGCANGSWARLVAERVGITGCVLGIDHDGELICQSQESVRNTHLDGRMMFNVIDIDKNVDEIDSDYDVITMFNVGSLLSDSLTVLKRLRRKLKEHTGILILKDSAIASDFFWPISANIVNDIQRMFVGCGKIQGYDPNFALNCRKLLEESGFSIAETRLDSYAFTYPFLPEQRRYISQNAQMIAQIEGPEKASQALSEWLDCHMSENGAFFQNKNAIYTTTEFTHICKANSNTRTEFSE